MLIRLRHPAKMISRTFHGRGFCPSCNGEARYPDLSYVYVDTGSERPTKVATGKVLRCLRCGCWSASRSDAMKIEIIAFRK